MARLQSALECRIARAVRTDGFSGRNCPRIFRYALSSIYCRRSPSSDYRVRLEHIRKKMGPMVSRRPMVSPDGSPDGARYDQGRRKASIRMARPMVSDRWCRTLCRGSLGGRARGRHGNGDRDGGTGGGSRGVQAGEDLVLSIGLCKHRSG